MGKSYKTNYKYDSAETVYIDGTDYCLRIRSQDISNPVVLFLHGGCGAADRPFIMKWNSSLSEKCTMVCWDQRGAGLAYNRKTAKKEILTKELYLNDLHSVVEYLKKRFNKDKIIIVGHSFGSQLGVWYAQIHPENILTYVGIGQVIDAANNETISWKYTVEQAEKRNDKRALKVLKEIGPPVNGFYKDDKLLLQRNYLNKFGGILYGKYGNSVINTLPKIPCMFKEYSFFTMLNYVSANTYCLSQPLGHEKVDFLNEVKTLQVPVFITMGKYDYNTVSSLAEKWLEQLDAPYKKFYLFEKSGHTPQWEESEKWNKIFAEEILEFANSI